MKDNVRSGSLTSDQKSPSQKTYNRRQCSTLKSEKIELRVKMAQETITATLGFKLVVKVIRTALKENN